MVKALQGAGIDFRLGTPFQIPWAAETAAPTSFLVEITSEIDKPRKRAIAKILKILLGLEPDSDESG
jgi:hypothetical protein